MKKVLKKIAVGAACVGALVLAKPANAQITNNPAGVGAAITGGISPIYDTAVEVGIGAIAVGFAIMYVRKGLAARH